MMPLAQSEVQNSFTELPVLTFYLANQEYALPVTAVVQIIEMVTITSLPQTIPAIPGVINYRGKIVPVMDLRLKVGLPYKPYGLHTPIILVDFRDGLLGLIVDSVNLVLDIDPRQIESNQMAIVDILQQQSKNQPLAAYVRQLAKVDRRIIPLLQVEALLSEQDHSHLTQHAEFPQVSGS